MKIFTLQITSKITLQVNELVKPQLEISKKSL